MSDAVADRFELISEVAAGGMGRVFRARDRASGGSVALKTLLAPGRSEAERFLMEAAALEAIDHPGVVRHVAHGVTASGEPFIAMEWLEGMDLAARLEHGRLTVDEALGVVRRVAEALGAVHARGLVHRDVKPSNLFLVGGDLERVKLVDFGVARRTEDVKRLTRTGQILGTPCYMAPEQARGARDVDARADVFALGAVLYECIAGQPPFWGESLIEVLAKVLLEPAPLLGDPRVDALIATLLEKERERRPADGGSVARRIDELEPAAAPHAIGGGERRVLCLVLVGEPASLELDPLGPTQPAPDRSGLAERVRAVGFEAGARVEGLVDGSTLIVMDGPGVATDHAARAAALALSIRRLGPDLPIAVATGRAEHAGSLPVGEVARRATRLLARAGDGGIRIDRSTADLLGQRFELSCSDDDDVLVAEREEQAAADARPLLGKVRECVGRERELALLEGLFDEAAGGREARAALVIAPAGVGKSRVRRELCARLSTRYPELRLLFACGEVYAARAPFGLIGQAIRRRAGIAAGEALAEQRSKLSALLGTEHQRAFLGEAAQVPVAEENDALRAARRDPSLMGAGIRSAWHDFIAAELEEGPVLLVFDDLHWGDLPSIELVDSALRVHERAPLVAIGLARPDVSSTFPELWAQRDPELVRLSTLGRRAAERLVREVLGNAVPDTTLRWIVDRAGGNAFYLEELIRASADTSAPADLPDTVLGLLQARLDAFGDAHKRVLRAASVFGETFWTGGVAALLGTSVGLDGALAELTTRELVEPSPTSRFPSERELVFRHALVRDAAYAMLTERDRTLAHERVGEWLENAGERDASVLAEHYARGGRPARAGSFFLRAAEEALDGNDLAAAIERAERGIDLAPELSGELGLVRAQVLASRGDQAGADRAASEAAEQLTPGSIQWYKALGEAVAAAARLGEIDALVARAITLFERDAQPDALAAQVVSMCRTIVPLTNVLRLDLTAAAIEKLSRIVGDPDTLDAYAAAQLIEARGMVPLVRSGVDTLSPALELAIPRYAAAGSERDVVTSHGSLGWALFLSGREDEALGVLERGLGLADRIGAPQPRIWVRFQLGVVNAERDPTLGRQLLTETVADYERLGNRRQAGWARAELARAHLALGDAEQAESEAAASLELLSLAPIWLPRAHAIHALTLTRLGDGARARAAARTAAALQEQHAFALHDRIVQRALAEAP